MENMKRTIEPLFCWLSLFLCIPALSGVKTLHYSKVFANREATFDGTAIYLNEGIKIASQMFMERHPGVRLEEHAFIHPPQLSTIIPTVEAMLKQSPAVVLGGQMSSESIILGDLLGAKKVVFITATATHPDVTVGKPYVFRTCFSDTVVSEKLADYLYKEKRATRIGVLHNVSSPYSDHLSKTFIARLQNLVAGVDGRKVELVVRQVLRDEEDLSAHVAAFQKARVDHMVILSYDADLKRFVFEATNKGFNPTYVASDGAGSNEFIYRTFVKESPSGAKFDLIRSGYWHPSQMGSLGRDFEKAFLAQYRRPPNDYHAVSFDAAWLAFTALNASEDQTGPSVRAQLLSMGNVDLVTNKAFRFGADNSPASLIHIYRIDSKGIKYDGKI
jgi:branched-chain amino acid transport system substrate-binding protein